MVLPPLNSKAAQMEQREGGSCPSQEGHVSQSSCSGLQTPLQFIQTRGPCVWGMREEPQMHEGAPHLGELSNARMTAIQSSTKALGTLPVRRALKAARNSVTISSVCEAPNHNGTVQECVSYASGRSSSGEVALVCVQEKLALLEFPFS